MRADRGYFLLAIVGLSGAALLAGATALALATGPTNAALAPAGALCAAAFLVPGIAFFAMWQRLQVREMGLSQVGALLRSYRVVRVSEMAEKLRKSDDDTEQLIALAIAGGHVRGRLDARTGWFIADDAPEAFVRQRMGEE